MLMTATTNRRAKRGVSLAIVLTCVVAAVSAVMIWWGQRPVKASIASGVLAVRASGYAADVALASIRGASLVDRLPAVTEKVNGYAFEGNLRGQFRLDELGDARLFVDLNTPPFIVIRTESGTVVVNLESPDATRKLHAELTSSR